MKYWDFKNFGWAVELCRLSYVNNAHHFTPITQFRLKQMRKL